MLRNVLASLSGRDVAPPLASAYNLPAQSGVIVSDFANDASGYTPAQAALISQAPGTPVTLRVQRGSRRQQIKMKLGERPPNGWSGVLVCYTAANSTPTGGRRGSAWMRTILRRSLRRQ